MRVGFGFDVHKLVFGRKLIIGGIEIPFEKGLLGHSDADVLIHAIIDAIIGAAGKGDIGRFYPDHQEEFRGISSLVLLEDIREKLCEWGYCINNIDSTVVIERPKLSPYIEDMREKLSDALKIERDRINIKAKTSEGLGYVGASEGVIAYAVVTIQKTA